ncbi:MAG: hypothetical protein FIA95_02220 [Gemmatimonadetes bacterium]|nr:hypothetical protein [Gemmatimonadota bacterium]
MSPVGAAPPLVGSTLSGFAAFVAGPPVHVAAVGDATLRRHDRDVLAAADLAALAVPAFPVPPLGLGTTVVSGSA